LAYWQHGQDRFLYTALAAGGALLGLGLLAVGVLGLLVRIPRNAPPAVSVRHVDLQAGVDRDALDAFGKEQFPQMILYGVTGGLYARAILALVGFAAGAFTIAAATEWGQNQGLTEPALA